MCPKGHSLFAESDHFVGRWRWAMHARLCPGCAEVRAAERFVEVYAARAGRWPVAAQVAARVRRVRRAWKLAGAAAVIAVLLPLLLSGFWSRTDRISAASARGIRTVHWVGEQTIDGITAPREETIQYPDKIWVKTEQSVIVTDLGADRELTVLGEATTLPWHAKPYRYLLERPLSRKITAPEWFTLAGQLNGSNDGGVDLVWHEVARLSDGRELHTLEYDNPKLPWLRPVTKLWVDPKTDLVLGWDITTGWDTADGRHVEQRQVADRVEYNVEVPEDAFSTEPPRGEEVVDRFTPEGIESDYLAALAELESLPTDQQAVLAKEWQDNGCFNKLDSLPAADRAEIQAKLAALGIARDEAASAAQPQGGSREAQQGRGVAPPLTKEEIDRNYRALALSKAELGVTRGRVAEAEAEQAALAARLRQVQIETELRSGIDALQRAQKEVVAARAAAKRGDGKARARQKQAEARAAQLQARAKALRAEQAATQLQLEQTRKRLAEARKKAVAAQVRIYEAQYALQAARAAEAERQAEAARQRSKRK